MGLGRNATLARSIQYQWSNPNAMRDIQTCTLGLGSTSQISHYAYEIAAYIIGKTVDPAMDHTDYDTATNADHVAAGRAYTQSDSSGCDPIDTYCAVGSGENLGDNSTTVVTLKEDPQGYFAQGECL